MLGNALEDNTAAMAVRWHDGALTWQRLFPIDPTNPAAARLARHHDHFCTLAAAY
jgi:hypothetical protein